MHEQRWKVRIHQPNAVRKIYLEYPPWLWATAAMGNGGRNKKDYTVNGSPEARRELGRRLALLEPLFRDLGAWIIGGYAKAGILDAMPDGSFPVADAKFRKTRGLLGRTSWTYSPHGPVYLNITRSGRLLLADQEQDTVITEAIKDRTAFAWPQDLPEVSHATLFLMRPETSDLYIRTTEPDIPHSPVLVRPLGQYARERAGRFIAAFEATR